MNKIKNEVNLHNVNNVTRTQAYLAFYKRFPEIHWSYLAHMVSRNTGWNMTDLKGSLLPRLLDNTECKSFFAFLERGNWLIFKDAFPQLLLYEQSIKERRCLAHLLPFFQVSSFMEIIWSHFWKKKDPRMITYALIINEQNHLESAMMHEPFFQKEVFGKWEYAFQDLLSMNQILFPYRTSKGVRLKGKSIHQFESLHNRIMIGKDLYSILFNNRKQLANSERWAFNTSHSGSRTDYWPHLFSANKEETRTKIYQKRLEDCTLLSEDLPLYSPYLTDVWENERHENADIHDWFKDTGVLRYMKDNKRIRIRKSNIQPDYCRTLEMLELAVLAKSLL